MKVLFIAADNYRTSGAFISMTVLNRILNREHKIDTHVIVPWVGEGTKLLNDDNIPSSLVRSFRWSMPGNTKKNALFYGKVMLKKMYNVFAAYKVVKIAKQIKADIIHINATDSYIGAKAAMKLGIPCVWHIREFMEEDHKKALWDSEKNRKFIGESTRVIAISNSLADKYKPYCLKDNLKMIHNGIDTSICYKPNKEIFKNEKVIFIYGGGYSKGKGLDELAYAIAEINKSYFSNFEFWLLGICPEPYKKLFASLGLTDQVKFIGYQKNVAVWYEKADISFNCSACEAFGRKTVEAMLAGNLVIAANTGGTLDIVEHKKTGLLYQQGDPLDLMNKIVYALSHSAEMIQIAKAGKDHAASHFSAQRNAEEIVALYKEIVSEHKYSSGN